MPKQKMQMVRLAKIAARLKENRYPNSVSLLDDFQKLSSALGINIACTKKTILRDFDALKKDFGCPLAFDYQKNGFYLKHHGWNFIAPAILDENEMLAAVMGARISEDIVPSPLKERIRDAVDSILQTNNPDFLDTANMGSLSILSGFSVTLDKNIFMTMFEAWLKHHVVRIVYVDYAGKGTERNFEPHTFVFYNNFWYSKGFCRLKQQTRTFALHRIQKAEILPFRFIPSDEIIKSVNVNDFLGFQRIQNVVIRIDPKVRDQFIARPMHSGQSIDSQNIVRIPSVSKEILFPFLLSVEGGAELLEPPELRNEFCAILRSILNKYDIP